MPIERCRRRSVPPSAAAPTRASSSARSSVAPSCFSRTRRSRCSSARRDDRAGSAVLPTRSAARTASSPGPDDRQPAIAASRCRQAESRGRSSCRASAATPPRYCADRIRAARRQTGDQRLGGVGVERPTARIRASSTSAPWNCAARRTPAPLERRQTAAPAAPPRRRRAGLRIPIRSSVSISMR